MSPCAALSMIVTSHTVETRSHHSVIYIILLSRVTTTCFRLRTAATAHSTVIYRRTTPFRGHGPLPFRNLHTPHRDTTAERRRRAPPGTRDVVLERWSAVRGVVRGIMAVRYPSRPRLIARCRCRRGRARGRGRSSNRRRGCHGGPVGIAVDRRLLTGHPLADDGLQTLQLCVDFL